MGSNVLLEAKLAKKIDTYLYSSHKYGDFSVQILTMFGKLVNLFSLNILNTRVEI